MTVTCATVRRAFGEFQCDGMRPFNHHTVDAHYKFLICRAARAVLDRNKVSTMCEPSHPALLRAIQEEANG